jgi:hypothetical protein
MSCSETCLRCLRLREGTVGPASHSESMQRQDSSHILVGPFRVLVVHTCNCSYSGGRDQEDGGSKPVQANSLKDPILKNPSQKKAWWSGSKPLPEFKPQY